MHCIAIINQKGGVGKTTTAVNLGVALSRHDQCVLLIDLDPQAHLTLHLGAIFPKSGIPGRRSRTAVKHSEMIFKRGVSCTSP